MKSVRSFVDTVMHGLYPRCCKLCSKELTARGELICGICKNDLPQSHTGNDANGHPILELFFGRVAIHHGYALYGFEKDSVVQKLLHQIKYNDHPHLAHFMGTLMGKQLKELAWFNDIDVLLPVPIHPKKRFIRGYNQSEELANGIEQQTKKQVNSQLLQRTLHTASQTTQGRFNRWENIQNAFKAKNVAHQYKHVGLVDDVITTGSTLEKIAIDLRTLYPDIKISVLTLALAK